MILLKDAILIIFVVVAVDQCYSDEAGRATSDVRNVKDIERMSNATLRNRNDNDNTFNYFTSGSYAGNTVWQNIEAFERIKFVPIATGTGNPELSTSVEILNEQTVIPFPIGIAPTGLHKLAHSDGEKATARAAARMKMPMILSCFSTTTIEDVANAAMEVDRDAILWMQVYLFENESLTEHLVRTAARSGYKAIVLTADGIADSSFAHGDRVQLPRGIWLVNLEPKPSDDELNMPFRAPNPPPYDRRQTWDYIAKLKKWSGDLPVIAKAILTADDARNALRAGADAIYVSNSGGRQLPSAAPIDVLAPIVVATREECDRLDRATCDVYVDSGVRCGLDVFKALALGAKMVFIGRPIIWGLAYNGEDGVSKVIKFMQDIFIEAMRQTGCASTDKINITRLDQHHLPPRANDASTRNALRSTTYLPSNFRRVIARSLAEKQQKIDSCRRSSRIIAQELKTRIGELQSATHELETQIEKGQSTKHIPCGPNWQLLKRYNMGNMNAIQADWEIETHPAGFVNNERQEYINSSEVISTRNGHLVIRAFRRDGKYFSSRLHSKAQFSPADHTGKKLKVEFKAKVPTKAGAWPALWMLGQSGTYGDYPRQGAINVMEWVNQIGDTSRATLHWKSGGSDLSDEFHISRAEMANNFNTYGVEYSNHIYDEYVQFYIIKENDGTEWRVKHNKDTWIWTDFPPCGYKYTAEASHCSYLAPFDNKMTLILNLAVGGDWGNCCGVKPSDYNAFDGEGVEMEISDVAVYFAANH